MNLELNEEYGAGFEGTPSLLYKYIKDTPGQRIQQFNTEMNQQKYKTYQEFEAQHKKMYPSHTTDQIKAAYKKYSEYFEMEEAYSESEMEYLLNKWRETGRIAYRRPNKKLISLNGGPNIPEKQALDKIKDFFDKQSKIDEAQNLVSKGIYTFDGKKIDGARSSKLFLQALDSDDFLHNLSWKEWSESNLKDTSSDSAKEQFIDRLAKQIKMFNKKIDLNTWLKGGNRSFTDTVDYIFKLDPNIKYAKASGLKEDTLQEAVQKIDVEELLDAAAKMRKEFPQLRKGQSIMITLHNMNPKLYSVAVDKADAFTVDAKIPDLINFLDPKYYAESANLDEATGTHSMGTVIITAPENTLHGKTANIFHKFPDGRINVQHRKSDKKGDVINLTLKKGEYKLDEAVDLETARKIKIVALATGSCDLEHIHEFVSLNPNMESIVTLKETYNKYIQSL
jgi:hypothetical protein